MSGYSALHSAHQLAPKVSHTGCPLNELSDTFSPVTVVAVKSCAGLPTLGAAPLVGPDSSTAWIPDAAAAGRSAAVSGIVGGALVENIVAALLSVAAPHHEHHSDHHQRAGQEERERQTLPEGTSGAERDDQHERPDAEHPEQMALPAVVMTLHVGVHVLGLSCCLSGSNRGVAARVRGKTWDTAHIAKAT